MIGTGPRHRGKAAEQISACLGKLRGAGCHGWLLPDSQKQISGKRQEHEVGGPAG
jgi:hypothetical protein